MNRNLQVRRKKLLNLARKKLLNLVRKKLLLRQIVYLVVETCYGGGGAKASVASDNPTSKFRRLVHLDVDSEHLQLVASESPVAALLLVEMQ